MVIKRLPARFELRASQGYEFSYQISFYYEPNKPLLTGEIEQLDNAYWRLQITDRLGQELEDRSRFDFLQNALLRFFNFCGEWERINTYPTQSLYTHHE